MSRSSDKLHKSVLHDLETIDFHGFSTICPTRGWLDRKRDSDGKGTDYDEDTFTYEYEPGSTHLIATVTGPAHTVTNTWDSTRNVLASKSNAITLGTNPPIPSSFAYTVNAIGQRTAVGPVCCALI